MPHPDTALAVAPLNDLVNGGPKVVRGNHHNIVVFADAGQAWAVDNRCPHMGFPLERGTVKDGILTCHWHEARFDLDSGCTFDLWADDVLRFDTWIEDGQVWVAAEPANQRGSTYYRTRLAQGIEQDIALVQAKSLLALMQDQSDLAPLLTTVMDLATENLDSVTEGMHRLGCVANLYPYLSGNTAYQAMLYATRSLASEISGAVPHRFKGPLEGLDYDEARLKTWLKQWVMTRHADGTERTLLAGVQTLPTDELADLTFSVASERLYANGGHLLEACNKVFELSDHLGPDYAPRLFPLLVGSMTGARGREESTTWHHPIEIVKPLAHLDEILPDILAANTGTGRIPDGLIDVLLGDDPIAIIDTMTRALVDNVAPDILAREVSYAAALRLARFATSNEVTDWFNPQHTYIHSNAAWRAIKRSPTPEVVRTAFQAAIAVYVDRFLNVPPARLPSERNIATDLPDSGDALLARLREQLDKRANIDEAADIVSHYLSQGHPVADLVDTLAFATVREDIDFHSLQVLDAAACQARAWDDPSIIENIMVGVVRNLAAHCPTRRAGQQTALIAAKLQRGEPIYEAG